MVNRSLMRQCGECSILFLQSVPITLSNPRETIDCCPNSRCGAAASKAEDIVESAISWQFMHIIGHSGISEVRRGNLRMIAESQMGEWDNLYRSF